MLGSAAQHGARWRGRRLQPDRSRRQLSPPSLAPPHLSGVAAQKEKKASLDEVDPELLATFDKLGIPLAEQKRLTNVAVDAVFDSGGWVGAAMGGLFRWQQAGRSRGRLLLLATPCRARPSPCLTPPRPCAPPPPPPPLPSLHRHHVQGGAG